MRDVNNEMVFIDSRDVIARIEALEREFDELYDVIESAREEGDSDKIGTAEKNLADWIGIDEDSLPPNITYEELEDLFASDKALELRALKNLEDKASCSPDWKYGETLIQESFFVEYAQELAEEIGSISRDERWPLNHIDWEAAAKELKNDYMSVDFDGVEYLIRA